nr:argininosuccinate lyase [Clostridia bacterium]
MKLWAGRFSKDTDDSANDFNSSLSFDIRLYKHDIKGSIAHAMMLGKIGVLNDDEVKKLVTGLEEISSGLSDGTIELNPEAEDIHMAVEELLTLRIGDTGRKLHTARSRNDQIALDTRMYLRDECRNIMDLLIDLCKLILDTASSHTKTIMPGFTHMQPAQPITLAHHIMAYFEMFSRDLERLSDTRKRINVMPLGSCALAGTGFPIDREYVAGLLGFDGITLNSIDAVSDRDFVIELLSDISLMSMHLSR